MPKPFEAPAVQDTAALEAQLEEYKRINTQLRARIDQLTELHGKALGDLYEYKQKHEPKKDE